VIRLDTVAPGGPGGDLPALKYEKHDIEVVVDRLGREGRSARRRLTDSVETAPCPCPTAWVVLDFVDLPEDDPHRERMFSEHLACLYDDLSFDEFEPRSFSFNSPWGRPVPTAPAWARGWRSTPSSWCSDPDKTLAEGARSTCGAAGTSTTTS